MENKNHKLFHLIALLFSGSLFYTSFSSLLKTAGTDPAWKVWAYGFAALVFFVFMAFFARKMILDAKQNTNA